MKQSPVNHYSHKIRYYLFYFIFNLQTTLVAVLDSVRRRFCLNFNDISLNIIVGDFFV